MIEAGKVSILIHTLDRPRFLLRLLDYYESVPQVRNIDVIVVDASGAEAVATFERERSTRHYSFPLRIVRHDRSWLLYRRIGDVLGSVDTPYVMLAADDDLYFFDWIETGIELLDSDRSFGTVYGHMLRFELESFVPYGGKVRYFVDPDDNPPDRWLEGETAAERLGELGSPETYPATVGWYALQRTSQLQTIVDLADRHELNERFFEKLLIFAQAALHKTRRLDQLFLARQFAPDEIRGPPLFRDSIEQIERLRAACRELLAGMGFDDRRSKDLFDHAHQGDFAQMKRADAKRHLRRIAKALPFLRTIWGWFVPQNWGACARDERLPRPPAIELCQREVAIVRRVVSPAAAAAAPDKAVLSRRRARRA